MTREQALAQAADIPTREVRTHQVYGAFPCTYRETQPGTPGRKWFDLVSTTPNDWRLDHATHVASYDDFQQAKKDALLLIATAEGEIIVEVRNDRGTPIFEYAPEEQIA